MSELPLFPLNTVLFPGTPLKLHIFEERYKRMIGLCLETRQPFGVVLIRRGLEAFGPPAEPYPIGCTAQILQIQRLEEGRMSLVATGEERFRIFSLSREAQPYLIGTVELYPLITVNPSEVQQAGSGLRRHFERYLAMLSRAGKNQFDLQQISQDTVSLAYQAAALMQVSVIEKQRLLSIPDAHSLITEINAYYRREVALLRAMLSAEVKERGTFSLN